METYQEEYDRILREIQELEKSRDLSDDGRKKMEEMQKRANALENYVNESGRYLARIRDLQTEITTDMTKIYQMQQMVEAHSGDNSNLSNDEIQKMREYLFAITGSEAVNDVEESSLKEIFLAQSERYNLSSLIQNRFPSKTKIDKLNQLCDEYRELQESFSEEERTTIDDSDLRDTSTSDQGEKSKDVVREEQEKKLKEQGDKIEGLRKINIEIRNASQKLKEKRKDLDEAKKNNLNDDQKKTIGDEIDEAKDGFWKKIKEFKDSNAKDLYKELEDDAIGKINVEIEDKDIERERIKLIIELLNVQIDVLKSELEELMKDPEANADRINQIKEELNGLSNDLKYWNSRDRETQILSENPRDWKPLANRQSSASNGQYVSQPVQTASYQPVQSVSNQPVPEGRQLQRTTYFTEKIKDVVKKIKKFYVDMTHNDKKDLVMEAKARAYKKKREERISSLSDSNFVGEPVEKSRGDMQYLAFPPAKVVGADFYHTVQIGDKLQYVKEPLAGMDFSDEAIKARIYELQEKFGNTAKKRQGKRISFVEKYKYEHKKMDASEKRDYEMRQVYQSFLESPDKILKDFLGEPDREVMRRYRAIQLMCALEAANNLEEAGKACLHGMPKDLFGLGLDSKKTMVTFRNLAQGSLQNDIEKNDMAIAEKIRENLRISRTSRIARPVPFADSSPQPQSDRTQGREQSKSQPVRTQSRKKSKFQPTKIQKVDLPRFQPTRAGSTEQPRSQPAMIQNTEQSRSQPARIQNTEQQRPPSTLGNLKHAARGKRGRSSDSIVPIQGGKQHSNYERG